MSLDAVTAVLAIPALAGEAADSLGVFMPLNDLLRARLSRLVDGGEGHLDLTGLSLLAARDAGLK